MTSVATRDRHDCKGADPGRRASRAGDREGCGDPFRHRRDGTSQRRCRHGVVTNSALTVGPPATFTAAVGFDGAGPERDTQPTWRGVITAAVVILIVVVVIFFVYSQVVSQVRAG